MPRVIAISGPTSTGKTSLVEALSKQKELENAIFSPDLYNTVWSDLVSREFFTSYDEIIKDSEYVCVYLVKLIEYYESYLENYENSDNLIFLDCCWLDLLVYALSNMWCTHTIKSLQEDILSRIMKFKDSVDRIYLTHFDSSKQIKEKYRNEFKIYSLKDSRSLELKYYNMTSIMHPVVTLPDSDPVDSSLFIIKDLKYLGYLQSSFRF